MTGKTLPDDLLQMLVTKANANDKLMDGTMRWVMNLVAKHDVVYGLWPDSTEPSGVGARIVKGANLMREIAASGVKQTVRITAIACRDAEHLEALRLHVAADRTH